METRPRVALLIRSLSRGGAEQQLVTLASALRPTFSPCIFTFYPGGELATVAEMRGVRVVSIGKGGRYDVASFVRRAVVALDSFRPDVVYSFLTAANVYGALIKHLMRGSVGLVWGVRDADQRAHGKAADYVSWAAERALARSADAIIANSEAGRRQAMRRGLARTVHVVRNGVDPETFKRDEARREDLRKEWGIASDQFLVGMVARLSPIKDHLTFLKAARHLAARRGDVRFVCIGGGDASYREHLEGISRDLGLERVLQWAGERNDLAGCYSALDLNVLTSSSEGCPNSLIESQFCGTPVVSTDVGDARFIAASTSDIAAVGDWEGIAAAIERKLKQVSPSASAAVSSRARSLFSIEALGRATSDVLLGVLHGVRRGH